MLIQTSNSQISLADLVFPPQLIMFWEKTIPPTRRLRLIEATNVVMNVRAPFIWVSYVAYGVSWQRVPLKSKDLERITQPVLVIQVGLNECSITQLDLFSWPTKGEKSPLWPVKYAEQLVESLVNAQPVRRDNGFGIKKHSAELYIVKGNKILLN